MSNILKIDRVILQHLIEEQGGTDDFTFVDSFYVEPWRWGNRYTLIFKDSVDNNWAYDFKTQTGDVDYASYWEGEEREQAEAYRVNPVEVRHTKYVRAV